MPLISFSHPWYLLLLPLLVAGVVYVSRQSLSDLRGSRAKWSLGLRIAIVTFAVLALAGLQMRQPTKRLAVLFVLDQSDSIPPEQRKRAVEYVNRAADRMGPNDFGGVLVFGGDAYLELEAKQPLRIKQIYSQLPRDYTNVAGAIRLALASFPDNAQRRVVLLSDGNENIGSAVQEVAAASSAGVQVDVVPVDFSYDREVMLEKMVLPSEAKVGEPFELRVIARSTKATRGTISLLRKGELIARQPVELLPGPNVITFNQSLDRADFFTYEAVLETPDDELADNNRSLGFVLVRGKPKVLVVESNPEDAVYLANALQGQQLQVDVRQPGRLPATLAEFQTYDSIVLSNVAAYQLTPDQMKAIRSSVRDLGAGLVMIGGENSFGPGAYRGTPIEEALPVEMEVKKQKVMPVGAVALVLHTCEFPDGNRWARETAAAVVDILGERDKVGVLLFDMKGENWGIPLQMASNKEKIKAELYNLEPGDMPDFHGIVKKANEGLMTDAKDAAVKHIIVISDGDPSPPSPELMAQIAANKITMSTVSVFPHGGGSGTLEAMAKIGKGEYYDVKSPQEIPRIFLKEAQRVLKPAIINGKFTPRMLKESQVLTGLNGVPPLTGYVATTAKEAPSVEIGMTSDKDDPILVSWRYGLGKAVAFTSDAKNHWAAPWLLSGTTFAKFWAQTIRWTVRTTSRADLDATVDINQRQGKVVVDVVNARGEFVNGLDLRGSVAGESRSPRLRMEQTGPGRYEGEFDAGEKGQYMIGLRYTDPNGTPRSHVVGAAVPYSPEYRDLSDNIAMLTTLADRTGGRIHPALTEKGHDEQLKDLWRHDRRTHNAPQDLWAALVLAAALLLPADIGVRRLMVSRGEWAAMGASLYAATLGRLRGAGTRAEREEQTGRLLGAKQRAARRMGTEEGEPEAPATEVSAPTAEPVPPPERPVYQGPARTMPTVAGAQAVTPPPAAGRPPASAPPEERMPQQTAAAPAAPPPATPSTPEPPPVRSRPETPPPPSTPQVVWHKPVEGVTPTAPAPKSSTSQGSAEPEPEEGDSTSRLLKAKRRAKERQE